MARYTNFELEIEIDDGLPGRQPYTFNDDDLEVYTGPRPNHWSGYRGVSIDGSQEEIDEALLYDKPTLIDNYIVSRSIGVQLSKAPKLKGFFKRLFSW